jgi:hypothetical protein
MYSKSNLTDNVFRKSFWQETSDDDDDDDDDS